MKFIEASPPLSDADINKAERDLNILFPHEFKTHYLQFNGGYPEKDTYTWPNSEKTTINTFASIRDKGFISLEEMYEDLVLRKSYLPAGLVPFATDDGGNMFCISSRKEDYGSVYYHNNDQYNVDENSGALTLLNHSFQHFVESLTG